VKCSWEVFIFPKAFDSNSLFKIWGKEANRGGKLWGIGK